MEFQKLVQIIMKHCIDRDTAENIAQDILIEDEQNNANVRTIYRVAYVLNGEQGYEDYEDFENARADYVHMTQGHHGVYEYVVFEKYTIYTSEDGIEDYEECEEIDSWCI